MDIQPATVEQVRVGTDGRMVLIDAEASQVVKDLQSMIPEIRVRFAEDAKPPFWAVYVLEDDGRSTHLVLTQQATLTSSGTWAGLDDRIVKRVAEIDPQGRGGYDYLEQLDRQNELARKRTRERKRERFGELGEQAQRELRRKLGPPHTRIFVGGQP